MIKEENTQAEGREGDEQESEHLLELVDLSVHYGAVIGLDKVSIQVDEGELVAVMGPNGAGKSTVLKGIMGLAPVVEGTVYLRGETLDVATHEIVKQGISFVPQGRRVFTHLTIEENLKMGCLHVNDRGEQEQRLESTLDLFPILRTKRHDYASAMSGGQQQMLAIGRGLMANPDVLLLDEPTLGLAPIIVKEVFEKVSEISRVLNTTILVVEHNIKGILDIADRAYVLHNGRVAHAGTPQTVQETDILTDVFLGRVDAGDDDENQ